MQIENFQIIGKDKSYSSINGKLLKVTKLDLSKASKNSQWISYGVIFFELENKQTGLLNIYNKTDYKNFEKALYSMNNDSELIAIWSTNNYSNLFYKLFSAFMPKLIFWICNKGSYNILSNENFRKELTGEARFLASKPIIEIKPSVMN